MAEMTWRQAEHERNVALKGMAKAARARAALSSDANERLMLTTVAVAWDTEAVIGEGILKKANLQAAQGIQIVAPPVDAPTTQQAAPMVKLDHRLMKLGKHAPRLDGRTLKMAKYFKAEALPPIKPSVDWTQGRTAWGMLANDSVGDCTCAAAIHMEECWLSNDGTPFVSPTDADALAAYSAITGYKPSDPNTDNGANELDVLTYWKNTGIAGRRIGAFVSVHPSHLDDVKRAIDIFGGAYLGIALPVTAQNEAVWDFMAVKAGSTDAEPGSWGGHAVNAIAYDADGVTVVTWGTLQKMTWAFWLKYVDECYALVSQDFLGGDGKTPEGFDLAALQSDLQAVSN